MVERLTNFTAVVSIIMNELQKMQVRLNKVN